MNRPGLAAVAAVLLLAALPSPSRAQAGLEWGVKGGLNLSGLRGEGGLLDSKKGAVAGVFGVYDFAPEFGVEVDGLLTMKGAKVSGHGIDSNGNVVVINEGFIILDYLEFPILARFNVPSQGEVRTHIYAGPTLAFKLDARAKYGSSNQDLTAARTLDSGLAFGASFDFLMGERKLVLDGRYGLGLTNAFDWPGVDLKNDAFSIMAGVTF